MNSIRLASLTLLLVICPLSLLGHEAISHSSPLTVEISVGEFFDKITILEIKQEKIKDLNKLLNVQNEYYSLLAILNARITPTTELRNLFDQLKKINEKLWDIEDAIRIKEAKKLFDDEFIQLARSVYFTNDERARIKREINTLLGSRLVEEKLLPEYKTVPA